MKRCPKCGRVYQDTEGFCEADGMPLEPEKIRKSPVPVLAGCAVAAMVLIAGTVIAVHMIDSKKGAQGQAPMAVQTTEEARNEENRNRITITPSPVKPTATPEPTETPMPTPKPTVPTPEPTVPTPVPTQVPTATPAPAVTYPTYYVVNCHESITLRKSPSTSAGEYCQIPLGQAVSYVGTAENGFYKVIYNGTTGYALASYLSTDPNASSTTASSSGSYMRVVNCHESITLRKIPSTKGEEFCQIPLGATVEFLSTAENGFYMVSYNGYTGYALASYLAWS